MFTFSRFTVGAHEVTLNFPEESHAKRIRALQQQYK